MDDLGDVRDGGVVLVEDPVDTGRDGVAGRLREHEDATVRAATGGENVTLTRGELIRGERAEVVRAEAMRPPGEAYGQVEVGEPQFSCLGRADRQRRRPGLVQPEAGQCGQAQAKVTERCVGLECHAHGRPLLVGSCGGRRRMGTRCVRRSFERKAG